MVDQLEHSHPSELDAAGAGRAKQRSRWLLVAAVAVAVAALWALFSFGLSRDPRSIRPAIVGRRAPDFNLRTLDGGRTVRLADLRGQVVVLNFWASWCAPCRKENPALAAAWRRYRDQGVVFLGISFQDGRANARKYAEQHEGDWPLLYEKGSDTALAYGVYGVPETFFIDGNGKIAFKKVGAISYETLVEQISVLLRETG